MGVVRDMPVSRSGRLTIGPTTWNTGLRLAAKPENRDRTSHG